MQVRIGHFAEGFAWMVTDDGNLVGMGYADSPKEARQEAEEVLKEVNQ